MAELYINVEINFHQQTVISVFLESNCSDDEEKVAEIGLFSMFTLRMLANFGNGAPANDLAQLLSNGSQTTLVFSTGQSTGGFDLIQYPGRRGRKRFLANLRMNDGALSWFHMKPKGFGLMGFGLGYYAPMATVALLRLLSEKRANDTPYLLRLGKTAERCAATYLAAC